MDINALLTQVSYRLLEQGLVVSLLVVIIIYQYFMTAYWRKRSEDCDSWRIARLEKDSEYNRKR